MRQVSGEEEDSFVYVDVFVCARTTRVSTNELFIDPIECPATARIPGQFDRDGPRLRLRKLPAFKSEIRAELYRLYFARKSKQADVCPPERKKGVD